MKARTTSPIPFEQGFGVCVACFLLTEFSILVDGGTRDLGTPITHGDGNAQLGSLFDEVF